MTARRALGLIVYVGIVVSVSALLDTGVVRTALAVAVMAVLLRLGLAMIRGLANPVPEPPPAGELRKVKIGYRCSVCGTEVRMTVAPDVDPEPPRHCLEDMELLAPIE